MVTVAQKTKFMAEVCKMTRNPTLGSDGFFGWKFADLVSNSDAALLSIALQTAVQKLPHAQQSTLLEYCASPFLVQVPFFSSDSMLRSRADSTNPFSILQGFGWTFHAKRFKTMPTTLRSIWSTDSD
jgi:hypothetical protein